MCAFCIKCVMILSGNGQAKEIRLDFLNLVKELVLAICIYVLRGCILVCVTRTYCIRERPNMDEFTTILAGFIWSVVVTLSSLIVVEICYRSTCDVKKRSTWAFGSTIISFVLLVISMFVVYIYELASVLYFGVALVCGFVVCWLIETMYICCRFKHTQVKGKGVNNESAV